MTKRLIFFILLHFFLLVSDHIKANPWTHLQQGDTTAMEFLNQVDQKKSEAGAHPFYQGLPQESNYSDKDLISQSQLRSQSDPVGKMIFESSQSRQQFKIDASTDPLIVGSQEITANALEYIGGKGTQSIQSVQGATDEILTCEEGGEESLEICKNTLHVPVRKIKVRREWVGTFHIWMPTRAVKHGVHLACSPLRNVIRGYTPRWDGNITDVYKGCFQELGGQVLGSCIHLPSLNVPNERILSVTLKKKEDIFKKPKGFSMFKLGRNKFQVNCSGRFHNHEYHKKSWYDCNPVITIVYEEDSYEILPDEWTSTCPHLEEKSDQGLCHYVSKACTQGRQTRTIQGIPIPRDCWEETYTYSCAYPSKNDCGPLRARGCAQIASSCKQKVGNPLNGGVCVVFTQTYQCKGGPKATHSISGGKTPFCLDGKCRDQGWEVNDEMMSSLAQLSILKELQGIFTNGGFFKGEAHKCSKQIVSFKDCCGSAKGWGKDLGIARCSADEKILNKKRKKGLCHFVGTYCSKKILGKCVTKKSSYCCFGSKLLKVFHEQGRPQIGLGWGKAKEPMCRGFTIEEIQRVDFSKLDLSEVFEDLMKSYSPDKLKGTSDTLKERLNTIQKGMQPSKMNQPNQRNEA